MEHRRKKKSWRTCVVLQEEAGTEARWHEKSCGSARWCPGNSEESKSRHAPEHCWAGREVLQRNPTKPCNLTVLPPFQPCFLSWGSPDRSRTLAVDVNSFYLLLEGKCTWVVPRLQPHTQSRCLRKKTVFLLFWIKSLLWNQFCSFSVNSVWTEILSFCVNSDDFTLGLSEWKTELSSVE